MISGYSYNTTLPAKALSAYSNQNKNITQPENNNPENSGNVKTENNNSDIVELSGIKPEAESSEKAIDSENKVSDQEKSSIDETNRPKGTDGEPVTDEELRLIKDLKKRDSEVRKHEQAHIAASGGYARGGASYSYEKGPDGKKYATGGEIQIDTSKESSPEKTAAKMRIVKRAAMAPAKPSSQDRRVAAQAQVKLIDAEKLIREERMAETEEIKNKSKPEDKQTVENDTKSVSESTGDSDKKPSEPKLSGYTNKDNVISGSLSYGNIIDITA